MQTTITMIIIVINIIIRTVNLLPPQVEEFAPHPPLPVFFFPAAPQGLQ